MSSKHVSKLLALFRDQGLFVNESRKEFINRVECSLTSVVAGYALNTGSFCLMGSKGCGKTTVLKFLAESVPKRFPTVMTLFVKSYTELEQATSMSLIPAIRQMFARNGIQEAPTMKEVSKTLRATGRKMLVILDEFDEYYKLQNNKIVGEIFSIGNNRESTMKAIVAGSAAVLRDLVYARLDKNSFPEYVGYQWVNLNDQKYIPVNVYAAESYDEYLRLRKYWNCIIASSKLLSEQTAQDEGEVTTISPAKEPTKEEIEEQRDQEYKYYSGTFGVFDMQDRFHDTLLRLSKMSHTMLQCIADFLVSKCINDFDGFPKETLRNIYTLADMGVLKVKHIWESSEVSLASEALRVFIKTKTEHEEFMMQ